MQRKSVVSKKLKFESCKQTKKPKLSIPISPAQTSEESIVQCSACDAIHVDP